MAASQRAVDEQSEHEQRERSAGATRGDENDVIIEGVAHHTELLYNYTSGPPWYYLASLAVDYEYNYLYISQYNSAPVILNLNTKEIKSYLGSVQCWSSVTVDQETHDLYIGTPNGIYKYKPSSGVEQLVGAARVLARHVYFNRVLYYIDDQTGKVSSLINGHSNELVNMQYRVYRLVIDNEDVMFFSNENKLYSRQMDSGHTTLYYEGSFVTDIAVDRHGRVYFSSDDGIYEIIKYNASCRQVVSIKGVLSIAFDKDNNMIYSFFNKVYRLKPKAKTNTMIIIKQ